MRPKEHPFFKICIEKWGRMLPVWNKEFEFTFATCDEDFSKDHTRLGAIAAACNAILDEYLDGHDYVLTMDSDIVAMPFDIVTQLHEANPDGVTAPMVFVEGTDQFYDTSGFLEGGERIQHKPPYFLSTEDLVDLDCVGTIYLAPAYLYRETRYANEPAGFTDHEEVMAGARKLGMRVVCDRNVVVSHACLPLYGENWR